MPPAVKAALLSWTVCATSFITTQTCSNSIAPAQSEAPAVPWPTVFLGLVFLGFQSWCTHQSFIQRVLAAENLKEAQKGALYCAFLENPWLYVPRSAGCYRLRDLQHRGHAGFHDGRCLPALITRVYRSQSWASSPLLCSARSCPRSTRFSTRSTPCSPWISTKEFINKNASESKLVSVGKNIGIVFAIFSVIVGPMVYFFPAGLKTFLDSFVMLVGLPVLSGVFGGFFFNCLPKLQRPLHHGVPSSATAVSCSCPRATRCSAAMRAASTTCTPYLSCGRSRCSS